MNAFIRIMAIIIVTSTCYARGSVSFSRPSVIRSSPVSRPVAPTTRPTMSTATKSTTVSPSHNMESVNHSEAMPTSTKVMKTTSTTFNNNRMVEKTSSIIGPRIVVVHKYDDSWLSRPTYTTSIPWFCHPFTYWYLGTWNWRHHNTGYCQNNDVYKNNTSAIGSNTLNQASCNNPEDNFMDNPESSTFIPAKPQ